MASDDLGLPQSPAQAAETAIDRVARALHISCSRQDIDGYLGAKIDCTVLAEVALAALSADAAGTIAAARLAAEEMRERVAEDERDRLFDIAMTPRGEFRHPVTQMQRGAIRGFLRDQGAMRPGERARLRSLFSSSPEDQQKAAATPTIADPDGEARS